MNTYRKILNKTSSKTSIEMSRECHSHNPQPHDTKRFLCASHAFGLGHAKMCLMTYANNKGADQPAHPRSLISTFVVRCLDSIMPLVSISEISRL